MFPPIDELLSLQGIFGSGFSPKGLLQSNSTVPLAALLGVWLIGGRMLRFATGLVPILLIVMVMLGNDPGVKQMISGGDTLLDGSASLGGGGITKQGWFLPACIIAGIFLLGRGRLSFIHLVLAIGAASYLLYSRDFRPASIMQSPSSKAGIICLAAALGVFLLFRLFGRRTRYSSPVPIGVQLASLKPMVVSGAIAISAIFGIFLLLQPVFIEQTFPTWRSTFGVWMLCISLYAFNQSLPVRYRQWIMPAFWCVICLVIGAQLTHTHLLMSSRPQQGALEEF